jgi:hypothetical protein
MKAYRNDGDHIAFTFHGNESLEHLFLHGPWIDMIRPLFVSLRTATSSHVEKAISGVSVRHTSSKVRQLIQEIRF